MRSYGVRAGQLVLPMAMEVPERALREVHGRLGLRASFEAVMAAPWFARCLARCVRNAQHRGRGR